MAVKSWCVDTLAPSPFRWSDSEAHGLHSFLELPPGTEHQRPMGLWAASHTAYWLPSFSRPTSRFLTVFPAPPGPLAFQSASGRGSGGTQSKSPLEAKIQIHCEKNVSHLQEISWKELPGTQMWSHPSWLPNILDKIVVKSVCI